MTSTAICGSDLHLYDPLGPFLASGDVLGHETMGGTRAREAMSTVIDSLRQGVPASLIELRRLGRTLTHRASDVLAYFDRPGTSNGPTEALIIWSLAAAVSDVADGAHPVRHGHVIWSMSATSPTWLAGGSRRVGTGWTPVRADLEVAVLVKAQRVIMPVTGVESWTVVDDDFGPVEAADGIWRSCPRSSGRGIRSGLGGSRLPRRVGRPSTGPRYRDQSPEIPEFAAVCLHYRARVSTPQLDPSAVIGPSTPCAGANHDIKTAAPLGL